MQGANWSSAATNEAERKRDLITWHKLEEVARSHPHLVRRTPFCYYSTEDVYEAPWYKDIVYGVRPRSAQQRDSTDHTSIAL